MQISQADLEVGRIVVECVYIMNNKRCRTRISSRFAAASTQRNQTWFDDEAMVGYRFASFFGQSIAILKVCCKSRANAVLAKHGSNLAQAALNWCQDVSLRMESSFVRLHSLVESAVSVSRSIISKSLFLFHARVFARESAA